MAFETDVVFIGEEIIFNNQSQGFTHVSWDFGDGSSSAEISPDHVYSSPGLYSVKLVAYGPDGTTVTTISDINVYEGTNSTVRITVLEYYDQYPVENASVVLYESVEDWEGENNPSQECFTTKLGKCVFEGLKNQKYYVDVWEQNHNNYQLAAEDISFIETQILEPGYIHDFFAYVDYYANKSSIVRAGKKKLVELQEVNPQVTDTRSVKKVSYTKVAIY